MPGEKGALRGRARVVCSRCHERKVRCDLQEQPAGTCANCQRERTACQRHYGVRKKRADEAIALQRNLEPTGTAIASTVASTGTVASSLSRGEPQMLPPSPQRMGMGMGTMALTQASQSSPRSTVLSSNEGSDLPRHGFIGDQSLLSYLSDGGPAQTPPSNAITSHESDSIAIITKAELLPPPQLAKALLDSYFEQLFPHIPVLDRRDITGHQPSTLLLQAAYFAGSVMRRPSDYCPDSFTSKDFYLRVKSMLFLNREQDPLNILKALCLVCAWSLSPPSVVTLDAPWQLTASAVRLAMQLGLHRERTYMQRMDQGVGRRIWWYLFICDTVMAASYGRPSMFNPEDFDVRLPTVDDFDIKDIQAHQFCCTAALTVIINKIGRLAMAQKPVPLETVMMLVGELQAWIDQLPLELRLFDIAGVRRAYNRITIETHIFYFVAIITTYLLLGPHRSSASFCTASIVASSCIAHLYEEILYRGGITFLIPIHGWSILVGAVPQIYCSIKYPDQADACAKELGVHHSVLLQLGEKFPSAQSVRAIIDRFKRDTGPINHLVNPSSGNPRGPGPHAQQCVPGRDDEFIGIINLFPFPEAISPKMSLFHTVYDSSSFYTGHEAYFQPWDIDENPAAFNWYNFAFDNLQGGFEGFFPHPESLI